MAISPPAKSTTHPGQLDINFIGFYSQPGSNSWRYEIRCLGWCHKECLFSSHMRETTDRLHGIVGQKRSRISPFKYGMCLGKCGLRVTIFPQYLTGLGSSCSHGLPMPRCAFQSCRNGFLPLVATKTGNHFLCFRNGLPLRTEYLAGIHYFPGRFTYDDHQLVKCPGIKHGPGIIFIVNLNAENLFDSGHFQSLSSIK